jgi:predicted MPP superfamily phosphohydrolase
MSSWERVNVSMVETQYEVVRGAGSRLTRRDRAISRPLKDLLSGRPARAGVSLLKAVLPPDHLEVTRRTIGVAGLPSALAGLRVLHVSDLHWHPGLELARMLPALAAQLAYDVAVYTGDFIDDDGGIAAVGAILGRMPRDRASFAVMGNHDHLRRGFAGNRATPAWPNDIERLRATLQRLGITVLDNAARLFGSDRFYVAGVDDYTTAHDDLDAALGPVPPGAATLLLSHNPDIVLGLGARRPGLVLCGHTHGGQIRLPLVGAVVTHSALPRRYAMGLVQYGDVPLFVTRGVGYSGLDLRLNCPPEVAVLRLVPLPAARSLSPIPRYRRAHQPLVAAL